MYVLLRMHEGDVDGAMAVFASEDISLVAEKAVEQLHARFDGFTPEEIEEELDSPMPTVEGIIESLILNTEVHYTDEESHGVVIYHALMP